MANKEVLLTNAERRAIIQNIGNNLDNKLKKLLPGTNLNDDTGEISGADTYALTNEQQDARTVEKLTGKTNRGDNDRQSPGTRLVHTNTEARPQQPERNPKGFIVSKTSIDDKPLLDIEMTNEAMRYQSFGEYNDMQIVELEIPVPVRSGGNTLFRGDIVVNAQSDTSPASAGNNVAFLSDSAE